MNLRSFASTLFLIFFFLGSAVQAQTFTADQKQTLRGLERMLLVVEFAQDAVVTDGLDKSSLELEVAERLRRAGIRLMNEAQWSREPGVPYLMVYLNTVKSDLGFYSFRAEVKLNQEVIPYRNRVQSTMAATWEQGSLGLIGANRISAVRDDLLALVDQFIQDYQAVNMQ